jgi:hypothetical protein
MYQRRRDVAYLSDVTEGDIVSNQGICDTDWTAGQDRGAGSAAKGLGFGARGPSCHASRGGALLVEPLEHAVAEVQAEVARHVSAGESPVDELIAERRAAAANE